MPIQIIPRPEERKPVLPEVLFYFSLALVVIAAASYFILANMLQKTGSSILAIDKEMAELDSSPVRQLEVKIMEYQKKINDFSRLIGGYKYSSQIFPFIEGLSHPDLSFSDFNASIDSNTVSVSGTAQSFQTVAQQLMIFRNDKLIKDVALTEVSLGEKGGIPFAFDLVLAPGVFIKKQANE